MAARFPSPALDTAASRDGDTGETGTEQIRARTIPDPAPVRSAAPIASTTSAPMRSLYAAVTTLLLSTLVALAGCSQEGATSAELTSRERTAIGDTIQRLLETTYRFEDDSVVPRFMRLYADTGRVISAASGNFTTTRDSLRRSLLAFWEGAGRYMHQPTWQWDGMIVDVLSRDAAAVTARYRIPHWTPDGNPHVIGGVWTSVWTRRDGRWVIVQEHLSDLPRPVAQRLEAAMPRMRDTTPRHP